MRAPVARISCDQLLVPRAIEHDDDQVLDVAVEALRDRRAGCPPPARRGRRRPSSSGRRRASPCRGRARAAGRRAPTPPARRARSARRWRTGSSPRADRRRCRPCGSPRPPRSCARRVPTFSPMYSIGALSRSPSPMTIVPSIGTVSSSVRIASTAAWSDLWPSPCPIVCAQAIAACSTTRRNSSERSGAHASKLRQLAARRPVLPEAEHVVGLHQLVDLARALVDDRALAVAIEAADRVLVRVAVGAVDLHGVAGRALGRHRREPLGQAGLARVAPALVLEQPGTQPQQPRRLIVRLHLRDHLFHELMLGDRHAERLPLLRVPRAGVAARANQPGRAGGHGVAPLIEREHRDLEALARPADDVLLRAPRPRPS